MRQLAAFASRITPGKHVQLLPAGEFTTIDGRRLRLNTEDAQHVLSAAASRKNPMVLDYEHQTLLTAQNGQPAPAAGWFHALSYDAAAGLFATDVALTARAKAMVEADPPEYQYVSAVVELDPLPDGRSAVRKLHHAALTNNPAIDGMHAVAALTATLTQETRPVTLLSQLIAQLGLAQDATEAAAVDAVKALKTQRDTHATELAALKAAAPDPAKFVPVATFTAVQTELAALKAQAVEHETAALIEQAIAEGKPIATQTEAWLRDLAKRNGIAALKAHLDAMPVIAALKGTQTGGKTPSGADNGTEPTADQLAILKSMGVSVEAFKKAAQAA